MATAVRNISRLVNKSIQSRCSCGQNTSKLWSNQNNNRFLSHGQYHRANTPLKRRIICSVGVASFVTSSAWLFTKLSSANGWSRTVSAAEPWSDNKNDQLPPRQRWNFIADVVDKAAPAVVHISIKGRDSFTGQTGTVSNGSGFIVREDGLILTNAHVVANKSSIEVRLSTGESYVGHVQAIDPVSDLATMKINAKGLPTLKLGKSNELRPGEWVVALGSPLQLSNTVTVGIVSTHCRGGTELGLRNKDMEYIQTDAVINFGNSGGPLVNLDGDAIGINTMKAATGISFAIPSDYAADFLDKAKKIEKRSESKGLFGSKITVPKKRYLGITMLTLTRQLIDEIKLRQQFPDVNHGVLVYRMVSGAPADVGGMQPGDVILKINNLDVNTASDVYKAVEMGGDLNVHVQRGSKLLTLKINPDMPELPDVIDTRY